MPLIDNIHFDPYEPPKEPFNPPPIIEDIERLNKACCRPFDVLADLVDNSRVKNDVNSVFDFGDSVTFVLKKDGVVTSFTPVSVEFPNEAGAWYTTIEWRSVAILDGFGCYSIEVTPIVAGQTRPTYTYAQYNLLPYTSGKISNAEGTTRILSRFNDVNDKYDINMTDAFLLDSLRFDGKFGYFQDNTEIDNLEYLDGTQEKVKREDFTSYELRVDLNTYNVIEKLRDHVLAENSCWISDHNYDSYSHQYYDIPVIVSEGFAPNHFDGTRQLKGVAKFEDKVRRNRTHFQDNRQTSEADAPPNAPEIMDYNVVVNGVLEQSFSAPSDQDLTININIT